MGLTRHHIHASAEPDFQNVKDCLFPLKSEYKVRHPDPKMYVTQEMTIKQVTQDQIVDFLNSNTRAGSDEYKDMRRETHCLMINRVFSGHSLCKGLKLDIAIGEEEMRSKFASPSNYATMKQRLESVSDTVISDTVFAKMKRLVEAASDTVTSGTLFNFDWEMLPDLLLDYPEVGIELAVYLAEKVEDAGTLRAILECTILPVDQPNIQGAHTCARDIHTVVGNMSFLHLYLLSALTFTYSVFH